MTLSVRGMSPYDTDFCLEVRRKTVKDLSQGQDAFEGQEKEGGEKRSAEFYERLVQKQTGKRRNIWQIYALMDQ